MEKIRIIEEKIYSIREKRVILDKDLAFLYQVSTRALNQAVKRNKTRFPDDFMFRLSKEEAESLVSQNVIPSRKFFGGHLPYAFTEYGIAMLSSVLKSEKAINVNIAIMRVFSKTREYMLTHKEFARKLGELEAKVDKNNIETQELFKIIKKMIALPPIKKKKIGFVIDK